MSNKRYTLPRYTKVGIFKTTPSAICHQITIKEDVDPEEKESVTNNSVDLTTESPLTVDTVATLKPIRIQDPSKSLNITTD